MRNIIVFGILLSFSPLVHATKASLTKAEFCTDRKNPFYYQLLLKELDNRLSFTNQGGLLNAGVCWWHNRFTRNATYIAYYSPEKAKPTESEAWGIILAIRNGRSLVEVPGYENLRDFSQDWQDLIQTNLDQWQLLDGFVAQSWIKGLAGPESLPSNAMRAIMDGSYKRVKYRQQVLFHKLQLPGIPAHSWLVIDMKKTDSGYTLYVIDSNYKYRRVINYKFGDRSLYTRSYKNFVAYIDNTREEDRLRDIVNQNCQ